MMQIFLKLVAEIVVAVIGLTNAIKRRELIWINQRNQAYIKHQEEKKKLPLLESVIYLKKQLKPILEKFLHLSDQFKESPLVSINKPVVQKDSLMLLITIEKMLKRHLIIPYVSDYII